MKCRSAVAIFYQNGPSRINVQHKHEAHHYFWQMLRVQDGIVQKNGCYKRSARHGFSKCTGNAGQLVLWNQGKGCGQMDWSVPRANVPYIPCGPVKHNRASSVVKGHRPTNFQEADSIWSLCNLQPCSLSVSMLDVIGRRDLATRASLIGHSAVTLLFLLLFPYFEAYPQPSQIDQYEQLLLGIASLNPFQPYYRPDPDTWPITRHPHWREWYKAWKTHSEAFRLRQCRLAVSVLRALVLQSLVLARSRPCRSLPSLASVHSQYSLIKCW